MEHEKELHHTDAGEIVEKDEPITTKESHEVIEEVEEPDRSETSSAFMSEPSSQRASRANLNIDNAGKKGGATSNSR